MNQQMDSYHIPVTVADAAVDERTAFIRRTYGHLTAAIFAFAGLNWVFYVSGISTTIYNKFFAGGGMAGPLIFFGGFIFVSWLAESWARKDTSVGMQYTGLGVFVVAESLFFSPLLLLAASRADGVIYSASIATLAIFGGLTAFVFTTKQDFSFMKTFMAVASFAALGLMLCSFIFGFQLGMVFTVVMILLAAGYILYQTSNVLHHYRTHQHVAAALALFASVALLFWYILRLFMSRE